MLHKETIADTTLELLKRFMRDDKFSKFVLVGGTSLALQIGHRVSVDLDLFTNIPFDENEFRFYLERNYRLQTDFIAKGTVKGEIDSIQIDCINHEYAIIEPVIEEDSIRLMSLADICAMKLNAISGNGTRIKDFIDIAYLSAHFSLNDMLDFYERKYSANSMLPLKTITFFEEINFDEPIKMVGGTKFNWSKIENRLKLMVVQPNKKFENYPI